MKQYKFKTNGKLPEESEHIVEYGYGCSLQIHLLWRLINIHNILLDKNKFLVYCNEFETFIENEHKNNVTGEKVISHHNTVDMSAELLIEFLTQKFGD